MANNLKEILTSTAEEVIGRQRNKKQHWVTNKILDLCDERRMLRKNKNSNQFTADKYRLINTKIRKEMRQAKEEWIDNQCRPVEDSIADSNTKKVYEALRNITKTHQVTAPY